MTEEERALLDHLDHLVFVIEPDEDGEPCYGFINALGLKALGRTAEEVLGKTAKALFASPLGDASYALHKRVLESGVAQRYELFEPVRGTTTLIPQRDATGRVFRLIGSSRSAAGPSLVGDPEAEADARQSDLHNFVHLAAHDLRSPLNQITSITELLREEITDPEPLELVDMVREITAKAHALIGDVLSHADITGTPEHMARFRLAELIEPVAAMLDPMGLIRLEVTDARLEMDRAALLVVLRNLMDNAVKYAWPEGAVDPVLRIDVSQGAGTLLVFTVADNGVGLPSDQVRLYSGEARASTGRFGIMAIRALIRQRGGSLGAGQGEGGGARITFSLPGAMALPEGEARRRILF